MTQTGDTRHAERSRRSDGERTHQAILDAAMRLASVEGLGSITIGRLATETGISKSGVFSHFQSKEDLQKETIAAAREIFSKEVFEPALQAAEGLERLESLCESYLTYVQNEVFPGGCFFAHLLAEFDAPSGPLHDEVVLDQRGWLEMLGSAIRTAQELGELSTDAEPAQLAFELYAPMELANYLSTLHRDPSFVEKGREAVRSALDPHLLTTG